jgi:four helix bundle protein
MQYGYQDLKVYQLSYRLAMEIYHESKNYPKEERYSLTDQIRRSSRSVAANIAEGYRKRKYQLVFINKLSDSDAECAETQVWLDFAADCRYSTKEFCERIKAQYAEVGRMIHGMISHPEKFIPKANK